MSRVEVRLVDGPVPPLHPEMGPCRLWKGSRSGNGYGQIGLTGAHRPEREYVHRLVWMSARGPIPEGMEIHHRCEVTACARLEHLACVSHRENMLATPNNAAARNATKERCPLGHAYDATDGRGRRVCRTCRMARQAAYRERKIAAGFIQVGNTRRWVRRDTI